MKRHEIAVLRQAGFPLREVAHKAGVSLDTVERVLKEMNVVESPPHRVGRPPVALGHQEMVRTLLQERPDLPTVEILRLLKEQGYLGGKDPVYRLARSLRKAVIPPLLIRFEGMAGEFTQNDFGSVRIRYETGTVEVLHFFAARLKWSRWMYVEIVPNEQEEALIRALLNSFQSFGGVPLLCVFDNPKTIVTYRQGNAIQWNPTFAQVALDCRLGLEMCTPGRGQEKGSVENLVGFSKKNFFLPRRFHDRADVVAQLPPWLHEVNEVRPCRATGVTPLSRIQEERTRLRPLPIPPAEYALRFPVRVGPTGYVHFQGFRYSMPAETLGLPATLYLYRDRVRIMTDRHDETHPREPPLGVSNLPKHTTSALATVSGRRGQMYFMRQRLLEVGPPAEEYLTELVHTRPREWGWDVRMLFDLLQQVGPETMARVFQRALERGMVGAEHVQRMVKLTEEGGT
jgi:transposase